LSVRAGLGAYTHHSSTTFCPDTLYSFPIYSLAGGGPVGVEMAGEIAFYHPNVSVTLVHNGAALISNPNSMATPKFQKKLQDIVEKKGVKVLLNDSVDRSLFKEGEWITEGPISIKTKSGTTIDDVSLAFKAVGVPSPKGNKVLSSSCFQQGQLDANGYLVVDDKFQVKALPGCFGIGDAITYPNEAKTIVAIMFRHKLLAKNILQHLKGSALTNAIPPQKQGVMMVPFGPKSGIGYFGNTVLPSFMAVAAKSGDLFIADSKKRLKA
jgi:apoptosis-inducing factor 2